MKEDADDDAIESIRNALNSISGITDITYVSKEDALKDMTEKYGDIDAYIQMFGDTNFFKPSFRITYAQASEADNIVYLIQQIPNIDKINSRQDIAKKIEELKSAVSLIFTWLVLLLFIVSIFVIINTVKASVFARKDEIAIMRYVGASRFFIGFPFFSQGIVIGAISAGIAYFMQSYLYEYFAQGTLGGYSIINIIPFNTVNIKILIAFLVIGIVTGVTGSVISLRRYTKV
ncbi:Cell division protein FtsX [bioreactor metagenome]|uniref:Cell division protein FtsX n=1 Tax=bioreactor metagenome TaxID=1076179 RepID=A0A645FN96_9ZZZZ